MIASLSREIGRLEYCTICMILKHRKISATTKVYYLIVPPYMAFARPIGLSPCISGTDLIDKKLLVQKHEKDHVMGRLTSNDLKTLKCPCYFGLENIWIDKFELNLLLSFVG